MAGGDISPPDGKIEAKEATPTNTNHTTINLDAGGGTQGQRRIETMQQSARIEGEKREK